MRRALLAAVVAGLCLASTASAAPPRGTFLRSDGMRGPAVVGGALFYASTRGDSDVVKRLDLVTGQSAIVYRRPPQQAIEPVRSGGGRVAVEVGDDNPHGGFRTTVVELFADGRAPHTLARGLLRSRARCGSEVRLEDVSQEGAVLIDRITIGCRNAARARHALRRYTVGPPQVLVRWVERANDDDRVWRLAGNRLLDQTERAVRVRDLSTGATRRLRPSRRGWLFGGTELDTVGNLAVAEARFTRRSFHEVLRLIGPTGGLNSGRVLLDSRTTDSDPRFCGGRLVEHRLALRDEQLLVHDDLSGPPRPAFTSTRPGAKDFDVDIACDADTAVILDDGGRSRTVVSVVPLAP